MSQATVTQKNSRRPALLFFLLVICFSSPVLAGVVVTPEMLAGSASIIKELSPAEAKELIDTRADLVVIDVRNLKELSHGVIPGSLLLSLPDIARKNYDLPKKTPILVICTLGGRSDAASRYLAKDGFPEIFYIKGGIAAWKKAGYPVMY
ncbi:MAG: rhodanese-like domain-containing protein [Proteobacteria bacterium]|nr:rhodanese-like domain-containing protein [Pseudomonadota bacterium]MBU1708608.1 rhodanese-like domain-containing protein [Pseudomonadota bacterium]